MCEECFSFICPGNCPENNDYSAEFGAAVMRCSVCDSPLYSGDEYICANDEICCIPCVADFDTDDILRICEASDICDLLTDLGLKIKKA